MAEFKMPSLGADMEFGTLFEWYVKPGDVVKRGDVVGEVETEKGVIEIEIWMDGVVEQLLVEPGTEMPVGSVLAIIRTADEAEETRGGGDAETRRQEIPVSSADAHPMDQQPLVAKQPEPNGKSRRPRISPAARKQAKKLGVDLANVVGTGPKGAIQLSDVEKAAAAPVPAAQPRVTPVARKMAAKLGVDLKTVEGTGNLGAICKDDIEKAVARGDVARGDVAKAEAAGGVEKPTPKPAPMPKKAAPVAPAAKKKQDFQKGMRQVIAKAMSRSNSDIPHYYLETRIDMSQTLAWLEAENQNRSLKERLLTAVLFIKAIAKTLTDVPELNGYWLDDEHQPQEGVHTGFAIALRQGGLIAPAIHHADMKSLDELMADLRDLIMRTRSGRLRSSEMTDATITITNLGDLGVEKVFGVIYPPQVALVGLGKISDEPWVENGMIGVRPVLTATLAADHRATDGRIGGKFLDLLKKYLEEPSWMSGQ